MKSRNFADHIKNAMGTVFLLAGAFFVCSTLLSMRAVFADPIAPTMTVSAPTVASPRTSGTVRASARPASSRSTASSVVSRGTAQTQNVAPSRGVTSRAIVSRGTTTPVTSRVNTTTASRATASGRPSTTVSRPAAATAANSRGVTSRAVVSRGTASNTVSRVAANNTARSVRSRTATTPSRISLQGSAIRGSKAAVNSNTYTYLQSKLYTGNYSNIIDSSTGLISAEAYNNCMESYYACMDEICTARNAAQRRCACAGRVKAFAEAEAALEQANEELIKVSGELALLVATKGKDISQAFQLTDAEKVMNCVSWKETTDKYGTDSEEAQDWCFNHGIYDGNGKGQSPCGQPSYCSSSGNTFGFDIANIDGSSSDILASLQSWADAKENTLTIISDDTDSLTSAFENLTSVVGSLAGIDGAFADSGDLKDSLAETWGYELFEYAHNNVCNRVLDSCFNGIYEACGTPPTGGAKCGNGRSQCPYNYNSYISVSNTGTYELNFIEPNTGYTASNSATCFGYTTASGDPYADLRGPVADARRSIMQKYALDANADCDAYGEQLSTAAQNIGYQKVAAQQALQQKRLEFAQEEETTIASDYKAARDNFNECLAELYDCYTTQETAQPNWSTSRIKTYCAQVSNVPHCYEEMICSAPNNILQAVIDKEDDRTKKCTNSTDFDTNTCRNIITLSEILSGTYAEGAVEDSSVALREACLQSIDIEGVRSWRSKNTSDDAGWTSPSCPDGTHEENDVCVPNTQECDATGFTDPNAAKGVQTWDSVKETWGPCVLTECKGDYYASNGRCIPCGENTHTENGACVPNTKSCTHTDPNVSTATQTWNSSSWGECTPQSCRLDYVLSDGKCIAKVRVCNSDDPYAATETQQWDEETKEYGPCQVRTCIAGYVLDNGKCISNSRQCTHSDPNVANAVQQYDSASGRWGDCVATSCEADYALTADKRCVASETSCKHTDPNVATAFRTWNGSTYGACLARTCVAGYELNGNTCVAIATPGTGE